MNSAYDRWLTTPPEDGYTDYWEQIVDALSYTFYEDQEKWIDQSDLYSNWVEKLFSKSVDPKIAAVIIERTFSLYKIMLQL